jgi:hypothetical protein
MQSSNCATNKRGMNRLQLVYEDYSESNFRRGVNKKNIKKNIV